MKIVCLCCNLSYYEGICKQCNKKCTSRNKITFCNVSCKNKFYSRETIKLRKIYSRRLKLSENGKRKCLMCEELFDFVNNTKKCCSPKCNMRLFYSRKLEGKKL
jgi:hypothetical protein